MTKGKRVYSIKKQVLKILMGMLIPVLIFLFFLNWFVLGELEHKIVEANENILYLQCENMEKMLESIDNAMVSIITERPAFYSLLYGKSTEFEDYINTYELTDDMQKMMYPYYDMTACVLISEPKEIYRIKYNIYNPESEIGNELLNALKELVADQNFKMKNKWSPVTINGRSYLVRIMGHMKTYIIGIIDLNRLVLIQNNLKNNEAITVFYNGDGYYTGAKQISDIGVDLQQKDTYYYIGKYYNRYLVVESEFNHSTLRVAYLTPKVALIENLSSGHIILLGISIMMLLTLPIGYHLLKKIFFRPLDSLVGTMEQIRDKDIDMVLKEEYREVEFQKVETALYSMVLEIRNLKIDSYEKQLQLNHTRLRYYQEQIKPHFYLNILKNIYGMVGEKQYDNIQALIILLSNHLRYMMQEEPMIVSLDKEIQFIRNYIELQYVCMKYPPKCVIECDAELNEFKIPAISLLTFVENSVKYGMNKETGLQINVQIHKMIVENEQHIYISISDNGQGYDSKTLRKLNFDIESLIGKGHRGIYNVVQRYNLQFGKENVIFAYSNYKGAFTEIFIKIREE